MKHDISTQDLKSPILLFHYLDMINRSFWNDAYDELDTGRRFCANSLEMLNYISMNPNCKQDDISKDLCIDKGCVAKGMLFLEQHELVHRKRSETDRRAYELTLSPGGTKALNELLSFADRWTKNIFPDADPAELESCRAAMKIMAKRRTVR